jgi:hypothetical protein
MHTPFHSVVPVTAPLLLALSDAATTCFYIQQKTWAADSAKTVSKLLLTANYMTTLLNDAWVGFEKLANVSCKPFFIFLSYK